jgi:hypothetical protein
MNPVIVLVLIWRRAGWKHSQVDWSSVRRHYDALEELVWPYQD